jgi:hypothetical protein
MTMLVAKDYNRLTTKLYNSHWQVIAAVVETPIIITGEIL